MHNAQKRCPKCGSTNFLANVQVTQEWKIGQAGNLIECTDQFIEVVRFPTDEDTWDCCGCGFSAKGSAFNVKKDECLPNVKSLRFSLSSDEHVLLATTEDGFAVANIVLGTGIVVWEDEAVACSHQDDLSALVEYAKTKPMCIPLNIFTQLHNAYKKRTPPLKDRQAKRIAMNLVDRFGDKLPNVDELTSAILNNEVSFTASAPDGAHDCGFFFEEGKVFILGGYDLWVGFPSDEKDNSQAGKEES